VGKISSWPPAPPSKPAPKAKPPPKGKPKSPPPKKAGH
jgi:hypothetical protein